MMAANSEDKPRDINPKEVNRNEDAKTLKAQEKIDIKQSEIGREQSQMPADEHVEGISQIDKETKNLRKEKQASEEKKSLDLKEINKSDDRDKNAGSDDWDAENNRSSRHK